MTSNKEEQQEKSLSEELTQVLEEVAADDIEAVKPPKGEPVTVLNETDFMIGERQYKLVADHREGFNAEKLGERFSDVLARYDYIVGDWGYEQLRLKGFFEVDDRKALPEQRIDTLEDYLYEFCNFGCAYFVIKRVGGKREKTSNRRRRKRTGKEDNLQDDYSRTNEENSRERSGQQGGENPAGSGQNRNSRDRRRSNRSSRDSQERSAQNQERSKNSGINQKKRRNPQAEGQAHIEERREPLAKKRKPVIKSRQEKQPGTPDSAASQPAVAKGGKKGGYTIRKREE